MVKLSCLFALSLLLVLCRVAPAASTDIVPRGDTLNDAFASLARAGLLAENTYPADFLGEPLHTRGQLARLLETLLLDNQDQLSRAQGDSGAAPALRAALRGLQPELTADGVDVAAILEDTRASSTSVGGYVQPEGRLRVGGDSQPGSGAFGIYRATAQGDLGSRFRYVASASNWPQDWRRNFYNDVGPHDFSAVNEAYLEYAGERGLSVRLGRFYDRWGPGYLGATLLSDNAPPFDQALVAFPFSLGAHLGRDYRYSQMLSAYKLNGRTIYFSARRVEYAFSRQLNADFQENFASDTARSLLLTPLPDFYNAENFNVLGLRSSGFNQKFNANFNLGLSYDGGPLRLYGQFFLDDIQSPGHRTYTTPRKIAYLVGAALLPTPATQLIAEYAFADPTTYSNINPSLQLQRGRFDEIGLPSGPNTREVFLRVSQQVTPHLSLAAEGRDRRRHDDSFPEPNTRTLGAFATYNLDLRNSLGLSFYDYRQDPFPLASGVPVGNGFQPTQQEGNYGQRERIRELDLSYQFFF
ncbi:MAG: hypothetical protein JO250_08340 [Armatimonadetes bacterium]|nr:hypothetical protein [Armatimonadota bacterium]